MRMRRFYQVRMPDDKSFVVVSDGYSGMVGLFDGIENPENSYLRRISFFEFIKFLFVR